MSMYTLPAFTHINKMPVEVQLKHKLFGAEKRHQITFRQIHFIMDTFRVPDKTLRCGAD